ncbi:MAG: hypothetical protein V2A73_14550 [Pseudomonadota bacterium]
MRVPALSSAPEVFLRVAAAHLASLEADPDTSVLAEPVRAATERLRLAGQRRQLAWEAATAKLALRERADYEMDRTVREVHAMVLAAAGGDRNRGPYCEVFPTGLVKILTAPLTRALELLRGLESRLENTLTLASQAGGIRLACQKLDEASRSYTSAVHEEAEAAAELELAKTEWRRQYRASYGGLLDLLGDRARVESYFLPVRGAPQSDEDSQVCLTCPSERGNHAKRGQENDR